MAVTTTVGASSFSRTEKVRYGSAKKVRFGSIVEIPSTAFFWSQIQKNYDMPSFYSMCRATHATRTVCVELVPFHSTQDTLGRVKCPFLDPRIKVKYN